MESETGGATRPSCPFADVRPEGCICIALADHKRISVDYQSRFCFTESHVRCRRFQRAVPEIPNGEVSAPTSIIDDPRAVAAVATLSVLLFVAIIAAAFHGTWSGWLSGNNGARGTARSAIGAVVSPTSIVIGGEQGTASATSDATNKSQVPVLIVTPTPVGATTPATTAATTSPTVAAVAGTAAATSSTAAPTATVSPTPVSTPSIGGPTSPYPPVANNNASSSPSTETSSVGVPLSVYPVSAATAATPAVHTVEPGDTINSIGASYGVPTELIAIANNLTDSDLIMPGDRLYIPSPDGHLPPDAPLVGVHLVVPGDAMSTIAQSFGVSVATLMNFNGIANPDVIQVGNIIRVPKAATLASASTRTTDIVQSGDTLFSIAQRFGVTVDDIMRANGLTDRDIVRVGQVLIIPST